MRAPPVPTLGEMVECCQHNASASRGHVERFSQLARTTGPGPTLDGYRRELSRHEADLAHWTDYAAYYRGRVAKEGAGAVPRMAGWVRSRGDEIAEAARQRMNDPTLFEDRRLPREREPGDDDVDFTADEPVWQP